MDMHVNVSPGQRKGCVGWQRSGSGVVGKKKSTFNKSQHTRRRWTTAKVRSGAEARPVDLATTWDAARHNSSPVLPNTVSPSIAINLNKDMP